MGKYKDLTGQKFGRLTVVERGERINGMIAWDCHCECGGAAAVVTHSLNSGASKSCGCLRREKAKAFKSSHGLSVGPDGKKTRLFGIWKNMRQRCSNKKHPAYRYYGARGVTICSEWDDYEAFYNWAMRSGYADSLTIERIDNDGNYEPSNCEWATRKQQARNTRNNNLITFNGTTKSLTEWAGEIGITPSALYHRLNKYSWGLKKALTTPAVRGAAKA